MIKCKCGCGQETKWSKRNNKYNTYIHGHNFFPGIKSPENAIKSKIKIDENGCWVWLGYKQKSGHGQIRFKNKTYYSHRFSYKVFKGNPKGKYVRHKCNNPACVNPDHLELGTPHENVKDMILGYRHPVNNFIHSDEKIVKIKKMYQTGKYTQRQLGEIFGVNQSLISYWVRRIKRPFAGMSINPACLGGD